MADIHLPPPPPGHWRRDDGASSYGPTPVQVVAPADSAVKHPPAPPALKLVDLDPRWFKLEDDGPVVGLTFLCPHCRETHLGVAFHHTGHAAMEDQYIRAHHPGEPDQFIWELLGQEDFSTLSLYPSVDASKSGHWHGFITGGSVV